MAQSDTAVGNFLFDFSDFYICDMDYDFHVAPLFIFEKSVLFKTYK